MNLHYRLKSLATFFTLTVFLAGCAGRQAYTRGQKAELSRDYETAMTQYRIAAEQNPRNIDYRLKYEQARFAAAFAHFENGRRALAKNDLPTAKTEFTRALEIDPTHSLAEQELERINSATNPDVNAPPTQLNFQDLRDSTRTDPSVQSQLDLKVTGRISLQMTQNTRTAYESLAEIAGLNVIFDPDFRGTAIPIELTNVDIYEALDILSLQARAFWKPLNRNTIIVSPDNQTKRREYEEHVLKTIYLTNTVSSTEITEAITAIRTLLNMRYVAQSSAMNAIIIRDTPDRVAIAEKIIEDIDKSKPEVLVEAVIMEVDRNELRDLGIAPPTDVGFTGGTPTANNPNTNVNIRDLDALNSGSFSVAIPQALARALATSGHSNLIQNPSVRASDGKLASIKIGSQVPVPSGSFQPAFVGATGTPVVQYQYINVGVNLDITPRVLLTREISLVVNVVVSALAGNRDVGGIILPVLTNRSVQHEIRLKEGETNILGGIITDSNSTTITGLPVLNKIPFLKYFFGQERKQSDQTEIIIMLTPHVIRMPQLTDENMRGLRIGVETKERISSEEEAVAPPRAASAPAPQPSPSVTATPPARPTDAALTFAPNPVILRGGAPNIVNLVITGNNIAGAEITLAFDPSSMRIREVQDAGFFSRDGQVIALVQKIETENGTARISLDRQPGAPPISGSGNVLSLVLEPGIRKGDSVLRVIDFRLRDAQQNSLIGKPAEVRISVP
jgi:general secretion pathway protein D